MRSTAPDAAARTVGTAAWWAWVAGAFVLVLWLARWPSFPLLLDPAYHLLTAQQMRAAGGVIATDLWQFAPVGRPHLYPPVTHLAIDGLLQAGLAPVSAMRVMTACAAPAVIVSLGLAARRLADRDAAVGVWLLAMAPFWWWLHLATAWAAALGVTALAWWAVAVADRRWRAASALAALLWYTHLGLPWVLLGAAVVVGLASPPHRRVAWTSALVGTAAAAPWLWHLAAHRGAVQIVPRLEDRTFDVAPALIAWAAVGVWAAARHRGAARIGLALMVGAVPLMWRFPYRGLSGEGLAPVLLLAGLGVSHVGRAVADRLRGRVPRLAVVVALSVATWLAPTLAVDAGRLRWRWPDGAAWHLLNAPGVAPHALDRPAYGPHVAAVVRQLEAASRPGEIVWSNAPYAGGLVAALAGRAVSSGMLYEVPPPDGFDAPAAAHVAVWWRMAPLPGMPALDVVRQRYGWQLAAEDDAAIVFRQPEAPPPAGVPRAIVPTGLASVLVCGLLCLVTFDLARRPGVVTPSACAAGTEGLVDG